MGGVAVPLNRPARTVQVEEWMKSVRNADFVVRLRTVNGLDGDGRLSN